MNREKQKKAAMQAMIDWLADERELGRNPANILFGEEFDLDGLHYYTFKFQTELLGPWFLGVCGGFEGEDLNHCGHIFSAMETYDPATAVGQAVALVKKLQDYFKHMTEKLQSKEQPKGVFMGVILLDQAKWEPEAIATQLKEDWNITVQQQTDPEKDALIFQQDSMVISIAYQPAPLTGLEERAARNVLWPEAAQAATVHQAVLTVLVMGGKDPKEAGKLYVKACSSCLKLESARAIYTSENVMEPNQFIGASQMVSDGLLPVFNWVFFGLYLGEKGLCAYTNGLAHFGLQELEVLESQLDAEEICDFLSELAYSSLENDTIFQDGENIAFSDGRKVTAVVSDGVAVKGTSVKFAI